MEQFKILSRWGSVLFECEAGSLCAAVELAVERKVCLDGALLDGIILDGAILNNASFNDAILDGTSFVRACFVGARFDGASLVRASFVDARLDVASFVRARCDGASFVRARCDGASFVSARCDGACFEGARCDGASFVRARCDGTSFVRASFVDASFVSARCDGASFDGAILNGVRLDGASIDGTNLTPIRDDFWAILSAAPLEVPALRAAIVEGRIDGSTYEGDCACLIGTIANARQCHYRNLGVLKPNLNRPAERFFLAIRKGDTPETSQFSRLALEWTDQWLAAIQAVNPYQQFERR